MDNKRYDRNVEVDQLLEIWEWGSRRLHARWQRRRRLRNGCFIALAVALADDFRLPPMQLLRQYKTLPRPLLDDEKILTFWEVQPDSLLNLGLGLFTKSSPMVETLDRLRAVHQNNATLDDLAKKMRCREKNFGSEWYTEGHHPSGEVRVLRREMKPLLKALQNTFTQEQASVETLALEILAKGWQFGELPASWLLRKTPETLLNRANRLKLWQAAQEVLSQNLAEEEMLSILCQSLYRKITPSMSAAITAQGYSTDAVVDDVINFDMRKSRDEITA
jgi:hypothetical protein